MSEFDEYQPNENTQTETAGRPYISVYFKCCSVYTRVYRRPDQLFYVARCPKCLRSTRVRVAQDGTSQRIFTAS